MSASCGMIAEAIEKLAPREWAEPWDNVGLLVGMPEQRIENVLLTLDVTPAVIDEAVELNAGLIISHHPFPFRAVKRFRTDSLDGSMLAKLLRGNISLYAAHTNLDIALGGVNDVLADRLSLRDVKILRQRSDALVKIVTFVPRDYEETVWRAMSGAGAGCIGGYSECGFRVTGIGTFLPGTNTQPFIGEPNRLSRVEETRIETVAPAVLANTIVEALIEAHPYEEVAYDIFPLNNERFISGLGRIGALTNPMTLSDFAKQVREVLRAGGVRMVGDPGALVQKVAVCGGAGMEVSQDAVRCGAQVLVTGDIRYHDAQEAMAMGLCLIDAGHFATEFPVLNSLQGLLRKCSETNDWHCRFEVSDRQADIWRWF